LKQLLLLSILSHWKGNASRHKRKANQVTDTPEQRTTQTTSECKQTGNERTRQRKERLEQEITQISQNKHRATHAPVGRRVEVKDTHTHTRKQQNSKHTGSGGTNSTNTLKQKIETSQSKENKNTPERRKNRL